MSNSRDRGELVRVAVVARALGFDVRTVRKYVRRGVLSGVVVAGRLYVFRSAFERMRDRPERPVFPREG